MRILLAIFLAGCSAAPSPGLVKKLAHVSVATTARGAGLPESNRAARRAASRYLYASGIAMWIGLQASEGPCDLAVGRAIQAALPRFMLTEDCVRALGAASKSLQ